MLQIQKQIRFDPPRREIQAHLHLDVRGEGWLLAANIQTLPKWENC